MTLRGLAWRPGVALVVAALGRPAAAAVPVQLIAQESQDTCWAASAAMARRAQGANAAEVGQCSLIEEVIADCTCYGNVNLISDGDCIQPTKYDADFVPKVALASPTQYAPVARPPGVKHRVPLTLIEDEITKHRRPVLIWQNTTDVCGVRGHVVVVDGVHRSKKAVYVHVANPSPKNPKGSLAIGGGGRTYWQLYPAFACGDHKSGHCVGYYGVGEVGTLEPTRLDVFDSSSCRELDYRKAKNLGDFERLVADALAGSVGMSRSVLGLVDTTPDADSQPDDVRCDSPEGPLRRESVAWQLDGRADRTADTFSLRCSASLRGIPFARQFLATFRTVETWLGPQAVLLSLGEPEVLEATDQARGRFGPGARLLLVEYPQRGEQALVDIETRRALLMSERGEDKELPDLSVIERRLLDELKQTLQVPWSTPVRDWKSYRLRDSRFERARQ